MSRARVTSSSTNASDGFSRNGECCRSSRKRSPRDWGQRFAIGCPGAGANGISPTFGWSLQSLPRRTPRTPRTPLHKLSGNSVRKPPEQSHELSHKIVFSFPEYGARFGFVGGLRRDALYASRV